MRDGLIGDIAVVIANETGPFSTDQSDWSDPLVAGTGSCNLLHPNFAAYFLCHVFGKDAQIIQILSTESRQ